MKIPNMPTYVEDTHGRKYSVPQSDVRIGGQGAFFQRDDLAVKILFPEQYSVTHSMEADPKEHSKYQRRLIHLMAMPDMPHLSMPVSALRSPYCGYVMRFMSGLKPLDTFLAVPLQKDGGYVAAYATDFCNLKKRIGILRNLADLLRNIHNRGLVYCDLNPNNIFVSEKPTEAEVWLIDIDNLEYGNLLSSRWQTPWYRAPEIYLGQKNSAYADCYSFALIAFRLLTLSKPFDGKAASAIEENSGWDETEVWDNVSQPEEDMVQRKVESGELPFVGEPKTNNAQTYGISYQYVMTDAMQELFLRTLGQKGRKIPESRPTMNEWFHVLDKAIDYLVLCPNGHRHLGKTCFLCGSETQNKHKKIVVNQILLYAKSSPSRNEELEVERVDMLKHSIHEIHFSESVSNARHRRAGRDIDIPWKCFAGSAEEHDPDSPAFSIYVSDDGLKVNGCYDHQLNVSIEKSKGKELVVVKYKNRFYYELSVEEVG